MQNNGADDSTVSANGNFAFSPQADGSDYAITVAVQPQGQACTVTGGTGTLAGADVADVAVSCTAAAGPTPPRPAKPIPILSEWTKITLLVLLTLIGMHALRRHVARQAYPKRLSAGPLSYGAR